MAGREAQKRSRAAANDIGTYIEPTFDSDGITKGKTDPSDMQAGGWHMSHGDMMGEYNEAEDDSPGGMGHDYGW